MTLNVLYAGNPAEWDAYKAALNAALADAGFAHADSGAGAARTAKGLRPDQNANDTAAIQTFNLRCDFAPEEVDYVVWSPASPVQDFTPFTRCRAVLSLWAGVERAVGNDTLTMPLCRMVDQGLKEGMVEWVVGHVLRHHLGMDAQILGQNGAWRPNVPPLARDRRVSILGLGALGAACGQALAGLGFDVAGWSRKPKDILGVTCFAETEGLSQILGRSEILVLLLPDTAQTRNVLNATSLAALPKGAFVINPGRGTLIDDNALLEALETGHVAHATLDVFRTEPLPATHEFWTNPKVTVTPHMAADTRAPSAARVIAENIRRDQNGANLLYLVDRKSGY